MRRRALGPLGVAALVALLAGCVYYPTVRDLGGVQMRPVNGRLARQGDAAAIFSAELRSTGKFGDAIIAARSDVAREARLVGADGAPVARVDVPGATTVLLGPNGPHVVLGGLTRALVPGETVIVTLTFEKLGNLGVISAVE